MLEYPSCHRNSELRTDSKCNLNNTIYLAAKGLRQSTWTAQNYFQYRFQLPPICRKDANHLQYEGQHGGLAGNEETRSAIV